MLPDNIAGALRATLARGALALLAVVIALGGLFWLARAGYTALVEVMHPGWAASVTGGGLMLLALLLYMPMLVGGRLRRYRTRQPPPSELDPAAATAAMAGEEVARAVRERPTIATLAALGAGVAVGYSPKLRRALLDLLR